MRLIRNTKCVVIVDVEDMLTPPVRLRRRTRFRRSFGCCSSSRKAKLEAGPLAGHACYGYVGVMGLDDAMHHCQPEAGAFPGAAGGKERFEDASQRRLIHAFAAIAYRQTGVSPPR
jgi:hypothetical protein